MIADREALDAISEFLDLADGFMTEHHGERTRTRAVDDGKIGVTKSRRKDADANLSRAHGA